MSYYSITHVSMKSRALLSEVDALLKQEGIKRDANLDYICAMTDEEGRVIATGSCYGNTLRCFAVSSAHQGEGLLNEIISHLINYQYERGITHLFLYTKVSTARFFGDLGFHEIARVKDTLVFMENNARGFSSYLEKLQKETPSEALASEGKRVGALVMNANPFTLGHRYLAETAARACDILHLFVVSENASLVPQKVRKELVAAGVRDLPNIVLHDSGPYIISSATFPSYFLKDESAVIEGHAKLDLAIFARIGEALHLNCRFVGEEPHSLVTGIYNDIMRAELPAVGIDCVIVPRKELDGRPISASDARKALQDGDWQTFRRLVPDTTYDYFTSPEAAPVLERIRKAGNVIHY